MEKLYCPPNGALPQQLPDYWKFFNGVIKTDLQTLDDDELNSWGWDGPFILPTPRKVIEGLENISDEIKDDYEYNEEDDKWYSKNYDYIQETHKVVWFSKERRYIILPIEEDSSEYEIFYQTNRIPSVDNPVTQSTPVVNPEPVYQLPPILWNEFKNYLISSLEFNQYISTLMSSLPIVATSFPVAILQLEFGNTSSFGSLWSVLKTYNLLPPVELINNLKQIATQCNLPKNFIQFLGE